MTLPCVESDSNSPDNEGLARWDIRACGDLLDDRK